MTWFCASLCQASAATACATRSAAPTAACASPTEPTVTSACVRWASGELCARRVSGFRLFAASSHRYAENNNTLVESQTLRSICKCGKSTRTFSINVQNTVAAISLPCAGFSLSSPLFNETAFSYAVIPWPQSSRSYLSFIEFEVTFRPSAPDGTLLYSDDSASGDFLAINLVDRYVEFRFDCGSGGATIRL